MSAFAKDENCTAKVLGYYQNHYQETYESANSRFFNYFLIRENLLSHTFAYPELSLLELANNDENFMSAKMVRKAQRRGHTAEDLVSVYKKTLASNELCLQLKEQYKNPKKVRAFIFKKLATK